MLVSIRNADFWLWELRLALNHWKLAIEFLSAMRIFGFGNSARVNSRRSLAFGFYPQCGFLALGTSTHQCGRGLHQGFLSAMRIFGFGNSIAWPLKLRRSQFLSAMRIFGFGNRVLHRLPVLRVHRVSIRNADFWLWEPPAPSSWRESTEKFLSAMRIFGFGNIELIPGE